MLQVQKLSCLIVKYRGFWPYDTQESKLHMVKGNEGVIFMEEEANYLLKCRIKNNV